MCDLIKSVLFRFQNQSYVKENSKKLKSIDVSQNHLANEDIEIGHAARDAIEKVESKSKDEVMKQILSFYQTASQYLIDKLPHDNKILRALRVLHPKEQSNKKRCRYIKIIAEAMPFLKDDDIVKIIDEWKLYGEEKVKSDIHEIRIDEFWSQILEHESVSGRKKYPNLSRVVKAALTLAHSNADSERGLSVNKRLLGTDRTALSAKSVIGIRACKDTVRSFDGITNVPITKDLISVARASSKVYQQELEEERKKAEKLKQEKKEREEKEIQAEKEHNEKIEKMDAQTCLIAKDEENINVETSRANLLLKDAQTRLDESIKKNDMDGISIASDLLRLAKEKIETSAKKQLELQNKKRQLMTTYHEMTIKKKRL